MLKAAKESKEGYPMLMEQRLDYVLTTGGNWALGTIGDFKLTIDKGDPDNLVSFCGENVKKTGPTTFEMTAKDYYPEQGSEDPDPASLRDGGREPTAGSARSGKRGRRRPRRTWAGRTGARQQGLMDIAIYVAIAENGVIGRDNGLPWRLSTDMKRFKADTMGKPVVMGRKTWESFPRRPLPGRPNIVISRDPAYRAEGAETVTSLKDALTLAKAKGRCLAGVDEICILGGGEIYRQAIGIADRLYVTHVLARFDGDTRFPADRPANLARGQREEHPAGEKDTHATRYVVYERRRGDAESRLSSENIRRGRS